MINKITLIIVLCLLFEIANAQQYFQQEVNYKINVNLNDTNNTLSAFVEIEYTNNSPDELNFIFFHLWPNAYRNNQTALAKQLLHENHSNLFNGNDLRGYIDSLDFKINNQSAVYIIDDKNIDICKLVLNEPLKNGEKIVITTPFFVKIPKGVSSRLGHIDQSYQITQWYPKPAVYDRYGWHQMPYLSQGEFYSEFGSFDVSITLPQDYVVGATGDLQTQSEIEWIKNIANNQSLKRVNSVQKKTIRFTQTNVHDFAWFADKQFVVKHSQIVLPKTGKTVDTWAMYTPEVEQLWANATQYINDAITYYSECYGDYPYKNCTAVYSAISAGGGMEYPNITVIDKTENDRALEMVIMHEVGHNWLYGILGFNEREFPFLDEGINSFSESRYMRSKYGKNDCFAQMLGAPAIMHFLELDSLRYHKLQDLTWLMTARTNNEQPIYLHSEKYSSYNYGAIAYMKAARSFDLLFNFIGHEEFDRIMRVFYENWKFKHPHPNDLKNTFETETDLNLNWFFDELIITTKHIDYKISKIKTDSILVKNKGQIAAPVALGYMKGNKLIKTDWFDGFMGKKYLPIDTTIEADLIKIDPEEIAPELYRNNNQIRKNGILKKIEPVRFKLAGIIEKTTENKINFIPIVGWNKYNGLMPGVVFYNAPIPQPKFEYRIMPLWGLNNANLAGSFFAQRYFSPYNTHIQQVTIGITGKRFAYSNVSNNNFSALCLFTNVDLRNKNARSTIKNKINIKGIYTQIPYVSTANKMLNVFTTQLNLYHSNNRAHNPYQAVLSLETGNKYQKLSTEIIYKLEYTEKGALDIRLFAGKFITNKNNHAFKDFYLSGTSGANDYLLEETFVGRYETYEQNHFLASQFVANQGAFSVFCPQANSNDWLLSLGLSSSIPYITALPLKIYGNIGIFETNSIYETLYGTQDILWETGLKLSFFNSAFEIFVPIFVSDELSTAMDAYADKYTERIRFSVKFNNINPFNLVKLIY